jgi:hypothetical protein
MKARRKAGESETELMLRKSMLRLEVFSWASWKPQTAEVIKVSKSAEWAIRRAYAAGFEAGWNGRGQADGGAGQGGSNAERVEA